MRKNYSLNVEASTTVTCRRFSDVAPFLSISGDTGSITVSAYHATSDVAEAFADDLLTAAQEFYDAVVEHNARSEQASR